MEIVQATGSQYMSKWELVTRWVLVEVNELCGYTAVEMNQNNATLF